MDFAKRLENLRAYAPIEPPAEIARRLGIPEEKIIKLDANENLYGLPASVCQSLADARLYHIYPDPQQRHIRALISSYTERLAEEIVVGAGSDELIDLLMRLLLNPGDRVLSFTPTFPYYEHLASLNDAHWVGVSRNIDFDIDPESLKNIHWGSVKLVILTSPNNPTGNLVSQALLEEILSKKIWVLLDEAYYEFSQTTHQDLLDRYSNLIILRTSSKMFGMAGFASVMA